MCIIEVKDTVVGRVVSVSGELAVDQAAELKDSLLKAFEGCPELKIDLSRVESSDISGIQVLCAAHRLCVKKGMKIGLLNPASPGFLQSLKDISLYPGTCDAPFDQGCLWNEEAGYE